MLGIAQILTNGKGEVVDPKPAVLRIADRLQNCPDLKPS